MEEYTNIHEQVYFNLDLVDNEKFVTVKLKDLVFIFKLLEEFNSFFHNRDHYPTLEEVHRFIAPPEGVYPILKEAYYFKMRSMLPVEIMELIEEDYFRNPKSPWYFKPEK